MAKEIFVARFVEGVQSSDGKSSRTIVSGTSPGSSGGRIRIDLEARQALLALTGEHLRVDLAEEYAVNLAQTVLDVAGQLTALRDSQQRGDIDPSFCVDSEYDAPAGIPLGVSWGSCKRELVVEMKGRVEGFQQSEDSLWVAVRSECSEISELPCAGFKFLGCQLVALRPPSKKQELVNVRLYRMSQSPFLMLSGAPNSLLHLIVEVGDVDVCDVIAESYVLQ
ncbi:hypothetical protein WMF26_37440 [Sorangium sp. So ce185]|uniref:hypothetical protein n=1 Tax=Sorangium sp. So ce185 TaxID=3133287 RepID=UPI003F640B2F